MSTWEENRESSVAESSTSAFAEGLAIGTGISALMIGSFVEIEPAPVRLALVIGGSVLAITTGLVTAKSHDKSS